MACFYILAFLLLNVSAQNTTIQYYEKLLDDFLKASSEWEQPTDSRKFFQVTDENKKPVYYGSFDFIIVGAGIAGSVLANRLTESGKFKVLLLEAGGDENDFTDVPAFTPYLARSDFNWGYKTIPQKYGCYGMPNRQCDYQRGKAIGGGSVVNHMLYVRGNREDYNKWGRQNPGWDYENVLPYFKKSERSALKFEEPEYHGHHGLLSVENVRYDPEITKNFFAAGLETGRRIVDCNGRNQLGFTPIQIMTRKGRRCSANKAYIKPAKYRRNLIILDRSLATRILIKGKKARGVEFIRNHTKYQANSFKEVIISGGSINSPQILMLSGIGPKEHLIKLGIPLVQDLPVGEHLHDHYTFLALMFNTNLSSIATSFEEQLDDYLKGFGILTSANNLTGFAFINPKGKFGIPNGEYVFISRSTDSSQSLSKPPTRNYTWGVDMILLHPKSTGTIRLKSNDPLDFPLIDLNFFSDKNDDDLNGMLAVVKDVLNLSETSAFKSINTTLVTNTIPPCSNYEGLSDDYWKCMIKETTIPSLQASATCKMGPEGDPTAIVDNKLKVYGIHALRIVDASVIPFFFSAHFTATLYMIGEKASDLIREEYGDF